MVHRNRNSANILREIQIKEEIKNSKFETVDTRTPASTIIGVAIVILVFVAVFLLTK